jgi:tetratricopeptide (TPR) repeat protein
VSNALKGLTGAAVALLLLVGGGCDGAKEARAQVEQLSGELKALRGQLNALSEETEALKGELRQVKAQNDDLRTQRDGLQKRVDELSAAARPAPSPPPTPAQPPAASDANAGTLGDARERVENLASAVFERGQYDVARSLAMTAVQLGSKRPEIHFQIAYGAAETGAYADAAKEYERAVAALQDDPKADRELLKKCLNNWGAAAAHLGNVQDAERLYQRVLALDPGYLPASFNLGLLYAGQPERSADAVRVLQDYIVRGGSRGASARELILKVQSPQEAPAPAG